MKFDFSQDSNDDDDESPSSFATFNPTTPSSYTHLTDILSSDYGSSKLTPSSLTPNSSLIITTTSSSHALLNPMDELADVSSNASANVHSPYSSHSALSPGMHTDYQCQENLNRSNHILSYFVHSRSYPYRNTKHGNS